MNQESGKTGGFFSKMLQKVKGSPAKEPADLAASDEGPYSKEALNQMVERKRRDDAIRTQEFAELRQLRSKGGRGGPPVSVPSSAFLSSALEAEDRSTTTLQKIDAIEAQMAQQWWRGSDGAQPVAEVVSSFADSIPAQATAAQRMPVGMTAAQWQAIPTLGQESMVQSAPGSTVDGAALAISPDLEEAAILFAHGDLDGAKARLLELLVQGLDRKPVDNRAVAGIWHAVLDLYRAIGDEEGFEPLAIDYAAHFGHSAPLWFSMPEQLGMPPLGAPAAPATQRRAFRWNAPSVLKAEAVAALETSQQGAAAPWRISWSQLSQIDAAAVQQLAQLLEHWSNQPGQFRVVDAARLLTVVEAQALAGDAARPPQWWALRMAALRWLNRLEAFEQVALDYCVTYEVSPPSWAQPLCLCEEPEEGASASAWMASTQDSRFSTAGPATQMGMGASSAAASAPQPGEWEGLAGVIEGDATPWLQVLQARARLGEPLEIACDWLIRLDFVAAGTVLNWAAEMQALGHQLRFTQLHHLVAVFFHVIGIQAHAKLQVRTT
ncbi:MAG: STAS domain-containing protein [Comamonas sp.]